MPIRYESDVSPPITELLMPNLPLTVAERRSEAERLIQIARRLLDRPDEEMVVNYLDHAIEALNMIEPDSPS
ncbi:hypothetical protein FHW96_001086 [Novosphingobium sp. SG751A]|nr:hypothetical protein [Novosphingobium sp. SG751A]